MIQEIINDIFSNFKPPPKLTLTEWADEYRILSPESSAQPGKWQTSRAPYQKGMMDALNELGIHTIVDMTSSQVGKTEKHLNTLGYYIDYDPAPVMVVQPTIKMAEAFSKDRLSPMIRDTPSITDKVVGKSRNGENTIFHKKFDGGHVTLAGANSPASLASRPIRILLCDEIDRWPASAGKEGDPLNIAKKRTATFHNRKIILSSTPGNKYIAGEGGSRIELAFLRSDQRYYYVPCPHCGHEQTLEWDQIKWDRSEEKEKPETAYLECKKCEGKIRDHHKSRILKKGYWKAHSTSKGIAGFHLSELYSPWKTFVEVVEDYLEAKDDLELYKVWVNTSLGRSFESQAGDQPDWQKLHDRRELWCEGELQERVLLLTAGVDVQKDRLEISIVGWNRKEAWLVDHLRLPGDTSQEDVWDDLSELLDQEIEHPSGETLRIRGLCIDSGYRTTKVYQWARSKSKRRVFAVKGRDNLDVPISAPKIADVNTRGKRSKLGVQLWNVGVSVLKSELYARLNLDRPSAERVKEKGYPKEYIHFPQIDEEYFRQLTSEVCVTTKTRSGRIKYEWEVRYRENHALDCFVYAMGAYFIVGANKWKSKNGIQFYFTK